MSEIIIKGSSRIGKTAALARLVDHALANGIAVYDGRSGERIVGVSARAVPSPTRDFEDQLLSRVASSLGVPYEAMAAEFVALDVAESSYQRQREMALEIFREARAIEQRIFADHVTKTVLRSLGRPWYLLFSPDPRQRKRGARVLGMKRSSNPKTTFTPTMALRLVADLKRGER